MALEKLKKAIQQGNHEGARIYGQDAIREKNQALNHIRMASRLDACCSRIETAVRMNQVSTGMKGVVKGMQQSLASMNIEQLSNVMDKFESQFEDLDVKVCRMLYILCFVYCFVVYMLSVLCVCWCLFVLLLYVCLFVCCVCGCMSVWAFGHGGGKGGVEKGGVYPGQGEDQMVVVG